MPLGPDRPDLGAGNLPPAPAGFEAAIVAMLPALRRYSRSLARSDVDGEDLLQQGVERALAQKHAWRGDNLRAWITTIITNLYRNGLRQSRRFPLADLVEAEDQPAANPVADPLERQILMAAIDSLPPDQRTVLMLVVVEGHSYSEVATLMRTPIGTVMSRLARARAQLAERLAKNNIIPLRRQE